MALTKDTAAIVAAHLTVAWAHRMGEAERHKQIRLPDEIASIHEQFMARLAGDDGDIGAWINSLESE